MAHPTLPVLSHSGFPQVLSAVIDQQVKNVSRIVDARNELCGCCYTEPSYPWSAEGGEACYRVATVYDTVSELELCAKHFRTVCRG